jgi:ATP-binding cassette subfamily F protein uup
MDKIVDHLFVLKGDGKIEDFPGNYSDYRSYEGESKLDNKGIERKEKKEWKKNESLQKSFSYKDQQDFKILGKAIKKLETEKEVLQSRFINDSLTSEEIKELSIALSELETNLERKSDQWLSYSLLLEK